MKLKYRAAALLFCFFPFLTRAATTVPALVPQPQQMQVRTGLFTLCPSQNNQALPGRALTKILVDNASLETGQYLSTLLFKSTGYQFEVQTNADTSAVKGAILLTTANALTNLTSEGYELTVAPDSVVIRAPASAGVFYGVQSLLQLLPPQIFSTHPVAGVQWTAPCVYIQDQPRFAWRGWMLDVVRHFFTKQEVKQLLDVMAQHKLNTFHWHLVDDQGWRIDILKYPLLTQVGAWRNGIDYGLNPRASVSTDFNSAGQYGGYYTQDDIREVVAYAQKLHITIVPEIEMPGHSSAGLAAYPQYGCSAGPFNMDTINYGIDVYSPGTPGTFTFLQDVLTEVMGLFPGQYIHCGGDEVSTTIWNRTPADVAQMQQLGIATNGFTSVAQYQSWFSRQIASFLQAHGRTMIGWSEIENSGTVTNAAVMDWITGSGSVGKTTAEGGQYVVMTPNTNCYINYYQTTDRSVEPLSQSGLLPLRSVYDFEPVPAGLAPQYVPYILGAQVNLWGEYVPSLKNAQFRAYPRLCALAEVTWTPAALKDYTNFTQRLAIHEQRLDQMNVNYDRESITQIGTWSPAQITTSYIALSWTVTTNLTSSGEVDVNFWYTSGADALNIAWVALWENGVEIDRDTHAGRTGASQTIPIYVLHLPAKKPGATYKIRAYVAGWGGNDSHGNVYLPNWN
ncbi:beta-N-acetylhexosaminidase [Pedosphaera parvula]|uniref:beta-N-acetylhexosaminidase n=1 Tax=Pedosphaera parvula (strain Ellin514) TaxID=320771 RepID=B9XBK0_PEDPL|nr:beta-N-acetylhexosaminidase [Pedosphaera parvula]EEF62885.1 Beta-N-acetylhexosaminidase [Pedosphaera parvula Ellin514]